MNRDKREVSFTFFVDPGRRVYIRRINITGNTRTAQSMRDNIDLDVSGVLDDTETLDEAAARIFDEVIAVCSGKLAAAERLGHREFAIHRRNPTI